MFGHSATLEEIAVRLTDEKEAALRSTRHFPPNLAGRLIFPQSDKDSVTQQRLVGPTEIGDLGDEFGSRDLMAR